MMLFISSSCLAQNADFNKNEYKFYSISISNLKNQEQANSISELSEKNLLSEFSWVDFKTGIGYFINNKSMQISNITSLIKSNDLTCSNIQEINLDNNLFLEIYSNRSGLKSESLKNQPLNYINLGDQQKSELFYQTAKEIWIKKYPQYYDAIYNNNSNNIKSNNNYTPLHYPKFIHTSNIDFDNSVFDRAKREWIKKFPAEYSKMSGDNIPIYKKKN